MKAEPLNLLEMQHAPPSDLKPYFQTLDDVAAPIVWSEFFGNGNPVEIDVGCGRGMFVVNAGQANPDRNYLGIEIDFRSGRHGARRLKRRQIDNVRIIGGDVTLAFDKFVAPKSVAAVHVYFPDPWWKRRHRRRRVFTDRLVSQMAEVLVSRGEVHSWTDVEEYFEVISALMDNDPRFEKMPPIAEKPAEHDLDYHTSFERKKRKIGCEIYRGHWRLKE